MFMTEITLIYADTLGSPPVVEVPDSKFPVPEDVLHHPNQGCPMIPHTAIIT